jgi:hypothetical protein
LPRFPLSGSKVERKSENDAIYGARERLESSLTMEFYPLDFGSASGRIEVSAACASYFA